MFALLLTGLALVSAVPASGETLGNAFIYQGYLKQATEPANGPFDFRFTLLDAASGGATVGTPVEVGDLPVSDGVFSTVLDFGEVFDGTALWLLIEVRPGAEAGAYQALAPLQALAATPYAVHAAGSEWAGLNGIPSGFADETDDDTLGALGCANGELPVWSNGAWGCAPVVSYTAGAGLSLNASQFSVNFSGSGASVAASRSDHDHWGQVWSGGGAGPSLTLLGGEDNGLFVNAQKVSIRAVSQPPLNSVQAGEYVTGLWAQAGDSGLVGWQAGVFARNTKLNSSVNFYPDVVLGGNDDPLLEDDGVLSSDRRGHPSSDLVLTSNDDITLILDYDRSIESSQFAIVTDPTAPSLLSVDHLGNTSVLGVLQGATGLNVRHPSGDGVFVHQAGAYASTGTSGTANGVEIRSAANDGVMVGANGGDGMDIWNAGGHGVRVRNAGLNGVDIDNVGDYAIHAADGRNYFFGDTGIGVEVPTHRLHVRGAVTGAASTVNHVALIENVTTGNSADILVIKMPEIGADIDAGNNYISFHDGVGDSIGAIQGNGAGSITYAGAGNDYAEWLPKLDPDEVIRPGDLVGVFDGHVSLATEGADFVLAASTDALVAGNDPGEALRDAYVLVAFLGQARIRVSGAVAAGDLVIPSGAEDGTGIALRVEDLDPRLAAQVVGQAWEPSAAGGPATVRSLVGLVQPRVIATALAGFEERLQRLEALAGLR